MTPRIATVADREPIVSALVAAFVKDPVLRWLFPGDDYPSLAASFFGHLFDKRVGLGTVWTLGEGAASALWDPPGGSTDGQIELPADALDRMREYDAAVHSAMPVEPHWYLGVLGTDPVHAGQGWGRLVMRAGLSRAAADGLPAYLETSNPANVKIYEKAGWTATREIAAPVPTWIMTLPAGSPPGSR